MTKTFLSFLLLVMVQTAFSQDDTLAYQSTPLFSDTMPAVTTAFISAGFANESPQNVREFYDNILDNFRFNGIPIPTQVEFGRTLVVNGGFLSAG